MVAPGRPAPIPAFVNPDAGTAAEYAEALGTADAFDVREVPPDEIASAIRAAVTDGATRIAVAGGDGTIGSAAAALAGTPVELAVLPGGTLNHFAKAYGIPMSPAEAVRTALDGAPVPADVAHVNGRIFLNTCSVGAYVVFVRIRERLERSLGYRLASVVAGLRVLSGLHTFEVELEVDGVTRRYMTPIVFIGVGERELRMPALGARVPGGRRALHVMVVRGRTRAALLAFALAAAAGGVERVRRTPRLDAFLVDRCSIRMRRPRGRVAVDGELEPMISPLDCSIARGALTVVAPAA